MARDIEINWDSVEPARSRLRAMAARVSQELASFSSQAHVAGGGDVTALSSAWASLVDELALGVEPALRQCPHCGRSILREAVRCRYCMKNSPALAKEETRT
jgi:hypothetical protein